MGFSVGIRAASVSLFAAKYLRYMFHIVCELGPFASASHRAISCIRVMPVISARPVMRSSISLKTTVIRSSDFFDGRPAFFGASEGVGVEVLEGWEALTTLDGAGDVEDDDNCAGVRGTGWC